MRLSFLPIVRESEVNLWCGSSGGRGLALPQFQIMGKSLGLGPETPGRGLGEVFHLLGNRAWLQCGVTTGHSRQVSREGVGPKSSAMCTLGA